ncbi:hypothetical protein SG34_025070 [Thalassomonas viridans]|uniref:Uncharacterized protein n=1 Tax=Thalassomonas viridans TaxID=137584 RepID=A0AAE9Z1L1_9GAMM|nr:DUF6607 family protein [Thalassomonas viridans]WDE04567.1 hypothetical protein SG34_025070 [Thalassomonas viridans]
MKTAVPLILSLCFTCTLAYSAKPSDINAAAWEAVKEKPAYNWTFTRKLTTAPRGGSSSGQKVIYDEKVPDYWHKLQAKELTPYERDRRAIYALEGVFETKFEFLETFTIAPEKQLDTPYASWGTEFVKVIEDSGNFISVQQIMVMYYQDPDSGKVQGPHVMKHWRHDWTWQGESMLEYQGENQWASKKLNPAQTRGKWVWSVYQVDDSPRYSGIGRWDHFASLSTFETDYMSRPLPRRESSVRDDYQILMGKDTLILTPHAWFHEQKNFKHKGALSASGQFEGAMLAREVGHNSYRRIKDFKHEQGLQYWARTKGYWADVRAVWKSIEHGGPFAIKESVNDKPLFMVHFEQAADDKILSMAPEKRRKVIHDAMLPYIKG